MRSYTTYRKQRIEEHIKSREKTKKNYEREKAELLKQKIGLGMMTKTFIEKSETILGEMQITKRFIEFIEDDQRNLSGFIELSRDMGRSEEEILQFLADPAYRRRYRKRMDFVISSEERKINHPILCFQRGLREILGHIKNSSAYKRGNPSAESFYEIVSNFAKRTNISNYNELKSFLSVVESESEEINREFEEFISLADSFNPYDKKEAIRKTAGFNMRFLIQESDREKKSRSPSDLEGKIMAFLAYDGASRRLDDLDVNEETLNYLSFLEEKTKDSLSDLLNPDYEEVKAVIEEMTGQETITQDDAVYLTAKILGEKRMGEKEENRIKKNLESVALLTMILEQDFEIDPKDSSRIAEIMEENSLSKTYEGLSSQLGEKRARRLIKTNPELLLLDNGTVRRYTDSLKEVTNRCAKYNSLKELDIDENPYGFASFESLHETISKINNLEKAVLDKSNRPRVMISKKSLERANSDGFIIENKKKYINLIEKIIIDPTSVKRREIIGEFTVSPMGYSGRKGPRVAFHHDPKTNTLFIDDLLYHQDKYRYVDNWNSRAASEIKIQTYEQSGYEEFRGEI